MPRLNDDRGAVAVMVAILMVPLMGFAAISIDIAATHADRQQLQTGADAAALAIAQDCARSESSVYCAQSPESTAQDFVEANKNDGGAKAHLQSIPTPSTGQVTVITEGKREHWFAPILGFDSTDIQATATAGWGAPFAGTARLPLVFSWCEFMAQTNNGQISGTEERTIFLSKKSGTGCHGSSGLAVPGGFGWVKQDPGNNCTATSEIDGLLYSDTGNNQKCTNAQFASLLNKTILLPIFGRDDGADLDDGLSPSGMAVFNNKKKDPCDKPGQGNKDKCDDQGGGDDDGDNGGDNGGGEDDGSGGSGNNAWYRVHAYAAFTVTGYKFSPHAEANANNCSNSAYCLKGYFTKLHDRHPDFDYSADAPDLGAAAVYLLPD